MSFFHRHHWERLYTVVAAPQGKQQNIKIGEASSAGERLVLKLYYGMTTILWQCSDPKCQAVWREEMIGQPIEKAP